MAMLFLHRAYSANVLFTKLKIRILYIVCFITNNDYSVKQLLINTNVGGTYFIIGEITLSSPLQTHERAHTFAYL